MKQIEDGSDVNQQIKDKSDVNQQIEDNSDINQQKDLYNPLDSVCNYQEIVMFPPPTLHNDTELPATTSLENSNKEDVPSNVKSHESEPLLAIKESNDHAIPMDIDDDAMSSICGESKETLEEGNSNNLLTSIVHAEPTIRVSANRPMLTIILSLSGLLLRRCWQKSKKLKSLKLGHEFIVLRSGCLEFLKELFDIYNVGIWSAANDNSVVDIIKVLEKEVGANLPFFMVWGQGGCRACESRRICRPDNPGVEALFKPLAFAAKAFEFDARRTLLIDDAPIKGCVNSASNCIFPQSFNVDEEDDVLMGKLYPYLVALQHESDVRGVLTPYPYGQNPIVEGHELYNHVHGIVDDWKEENQRWSDKHYSTGKIPKHLRDLSVEKGATSSTTSTYSTRSQDNKQRIVSDRDKVRLLRSAPSLTTMKGVEAIMLAEKLGFKASVIKPHEAKNYLKQLRKTYNIN